MLLIEELRKIIKEEYGISDVVRKYSEIFFEQMLESLKDADVASKTEVMVKKTAPMTFFIDDVKLSCSITYRNFLSKDYNRIYEEPHVTDGSSFRLSSNVYLCFINVYAVCGTLDKTTAMETIQHEIEHIYQQIKMGTGFGSDSLYAKIKDDMISADINRQKIGKLFYYTLKSEQEGFNNGFYAFLMDSMEPYSEELVKKSEAWEIYVFMKETLHELQKNDGMKNIFTEYFNSFGITAKRLEKEINNFLHRIGRTAIKAKQDKIKQGWR